MPPPLTEEHRFVEHSARQNNLYIPAQDYFKSENQGTENPEENPTTREFSPEKSTAKDSISSPRNYSRLKLTQQELPKLAHSLGHDFPEDDFLSPVNISSQISGLSNDPSASPKKISFAHELKKTRSIVQKLHHRKTSSLPDIDISQTEEKSESADRKDSDEYTVTTPRANQYHSNSIETKQSETRNRASSFKKEAYLGRFADYYNPFFQSTQSRSDAQKESNTTSLSGSPGYGKLMDSLATNHDQN